MHVGVFLLIFPTVKFLHLEHLGYEVTNLRHGIEIDVGQSQGAGNNTISFIAGLVRTKRLFMKSCRKRSFDGVMASMVELLVEIQIFGSDYRLVYTICLGWRLQCVNYLTSGAWNADKTSST